MNPIPPTQTDTQPRKIQDFVDPKSKIIGLSAQFTDGFHQMDASALHLWGHRWTRIHVRNRIPSVVLLSHPAIEHIQRPHLRHLLSPQHLPTTQTTPSSLAPSSTAVLGPSEAALFASDFHHRRTQLHRQPTLNAAQWAAVADHP